MRGREKEEERKRRETGVPIVMVIFKLGVVCTCNIDTNI